MGVGIGDRYVYSLWPTGVNTTDTASFNAALSAMDRGELVIRDNGKKLVLDGAVATPSALTKPVRIRGESPNVTVKLNNAFQVIWGIDDNPATSGTPAAFSGLNAGETKFQSPSLSLAQGDWVLLLADDTLTGVDGHIVSGVQHPAELHRVEYVSGSDIFLDMPVCDTYSVNPRVMKITMIPNCGLVDLQLESDTQYAPGTSTQQWNWKVNNTIDFRFDNVRCLEDGPGYIAIYKSARAQFLNFSGLHQATNYWDYGLVVGPCRDTLFADSSWSGSRHVVSTTGWDDGTDRWGTPRNTIIRNVTARVPDDNVATQWVTFDCHAEGYETLFDSCKCYIGTQQQGYAFSSRARKTIYKNCHVIGGNDDNVAKNNSHYGIRFLAEGCSVIGCRIENVWQGVNQRTGSQGTNYGGFSVIDTEFIDCSSVGIRQSTTGNGAYIKGNRFKNSGTYYNIVSPFIPKAFICIEGGTGHIIRQNDLSQDGNDYSIWVNTLSETDFDIRGNVFEGYGDGKLGIADGANSGTLAVNYDFDGAFSRYNVTDKSYDVINVMEYGAVGDGVAADDAAFVSALDAAPDGGTVYVPKGTYDLDAWTTYTLSKNLKIVGEPGALILGPTTGTTNDDFIQLEEGYNLFAEGLSFRYFRGVFVLQANAVTPHETLDVRRCDFDGPYYAVIDSGTGANHVSIERFVFSGNKIHDTTRACKRGVVVRSIDHQHILISGNDIRGIVHDDIAAAIWVGDASTTGGKSCEISHNYIDGVTCSLDDIDTHGIFVYSAVCHITNNVIKNIANNNNGENAEGIYVKSACPVITGNYLEDAGSEAFIYFKGALSSIEKGGVISNNTCRLVSGTLAPIGNRGGFGISTINPCTITGNDIDGLLGGIYVTGVGDASITGNNIRNISGSTETLQGIYVEDSNNVTVSGNTITDIVSTSSGPVYGIRIRRSVSSTSRHINVVGNVISTLTTGSGDEMGIGLQGDTADEIDGVAIIGNYIQGADQGIGVIAGGANISNVVIHSNTFDDCGENIEAATIATLASVTYGTYQSGSGAPSGSVTPDFIGQEYFDTSGTAWYKSTGLTNTDWQAL